MNAFLDNNQIEEFSHFDFLDEMHECYNVSDDDWHDYYDKEEYDDNSWENLGGVNAET